MSRAIVSDFGGVLTAPLDWAFSALAERIGLSLETFGLAMARIYREDDTHPLFALERGEITEAAFLERMSRALSDEAGRAVSMPSFGEHAASVLQPNQPMFDYYRGLRARGLRMAMCTNNVREWEPHWRALLPIDEVFDLVVDSAFVGTRKPEPAIYAITLERVGLPAEACIFIDDLEHNVVAAREAGMHGVHFQSTEQAIAEIDAWLGGGGVAGAGEGA